MIYLFCVWSLTLAVTLGNFMETWLDAKGKKDLERRFEGWWHSLRNLDKFDFAIALARKVSNVTDLFFGSQMLSWRGFLKVLTFSSLLLGLSILALILGKQFPERIAPWEQFRLSIKMAKDMNDQALHMPAKDDITKLVFQNQREEWEIAQHFQGDGWAITYSVMYVIMSFLLVGLLTHLSVALGRTALREIVETRRSSGAIFIIFGNCWLSLLLANGTMLVIGVLGFPLLLTSVRSVMLILASSFYWSLSLFVTAVLAAWCFCSGHLKLVVFIGLLPCIISLVLVVFTSASLVCREWLHRMALVFLRRCVTNGPIKILLACTSLMMAIAIVAHEAWAFLRK